MSDTAHVEPAKSRKLRSPGYPSIDLGTALKRAETFYDKERRNSAPLRIAAQHWGTTEKSSTGLLTVAAMKSFGLLIEAEGADRRLQLSELALRIVLDKRDPSPERDAAIKRAALMPKLHQMLWSKYGTNLPSGSNLAHELVFDWRFNENSVQDFIREYKATINFAKLGESDKLSGEENDNAVRDDVHDDEEVSLGVGDYVQWESQGTLQFPVPKRIREISEDQKWAFVEGSNTGLPMEELSKVDAPPPSVQAARTPPRPRTIAEAQEMFGGISKPATLISQDVFSLREGPVTIQWPLNLSRESFQDLSDWLEIVKRKIARSVIDRRARIVRAVTNRCKECTVQFDDDAGEFVRFNIKDKQGNILTNASPHLTSDEIDRWTEAELDRVIVNLTGGKL
ncbi:MAG: hypothetical protein JO340_04625 [Acidobacteriaceae bacterium]|nr:hypothetical protein [Acidobacteriaceae bacterium]